jgi:hypothetical protein
MKALELVFVEHMDEVLGQALVKTGLLQVLPKKEEKEEVPEKETGAEEQPTPPAPPQVTH